MRAHYIFGSLILCFCLTAGTARAIPLLEPVTVTGTGGAGGYTFGFSFVVGAANLNVASLGYFDANVGGLGVAHEVGIWNNSGTLLATTTIAAGTTATLLGKFRYNDLLVPITLSSGQTYVIGGTLNPVDSYVQTSGATINGATFANTALYTSGIGLNEPLSNGSGNFYVVNFSTTAISAIPEPANSALALGACALMCIAWRRYRV